MTPHRDVKIEIDTLQDADFWLNVHHRYSLQDIEHINRIHDRPHDLERPWWKKLLGRH
jgi:plasmid maintenance system antidote protein VapI